MGRAMKFFKIKMKNKMSIVKGNHAKKVKKQGGSQYLYMCMTLVVRVVKSSRLPMKIATFLDSIGQLLCLAFLYRWNFLNKISLNWPHTLTTQPFTFKLGNPGSSFFFWCKTPDQH